MEQSTDLNALINAFLGYRDMLSPVLDSLTQFVETYDSLRGDIDTLNNAFSGDVKGKLQEIYDTLAKQAARSGDLTAQIDRFVTLGANYVAEMSKLNEAFAKVQQSLGAVGDLEKKADEQLHLLDTIIAEKRTNYNIKDLQRSLENYNHTVQKVSDFINKDVGEALVGSNSKLDAIRSQNDVIAKEIGRNGQAVEQLTEEYRLNNRLLTKLTEQNDVDRVYLYELLDSWADERGIKRKH
jgi:ABC-type transporter Mla subunit MlaD